MSHSTIIFDNTVVCRESFKKALTIPHLGKDEWAETRFADFNLWAAGAGASAKGKGSLDVRLAFEEEGRNIVANLLRMLQVLMDKCIEIAGAMNSTIEAPLKYTSEILFFSKVDECDVPEVVLSAKEVKAMNDVESILNELIAVTVAIRKAGSHSRRHKADSEFDPTNPQISALRDHLEIVVLTRRSPDSPPFAKLSYSRADIIPSSKEGTSRQLSEIQRRLINANLHRRNRFLYSQRYSEKLAYDIKESSQEHHSPPPSLASLQKLGHWPDKAIAAIGNNVKQDRATQEILEEITKSTTTASLIEDPIVFPGAGPAESAVTGVSSTISKVQYPKAPNIRNNMSSFKCPCCCQTLPRTVSLGKRWKSNTDSLVAIKECHDVDSKFFMNEVTMLKALVPKKNPHLIQLLATYEHREIYHLMFPWADSHLGQFWKDKPTPKFHRATVLWSLQQMCGIAQGLSIIHECELMEPFEIPGQKRRDIAGHRIIPAGPKKLGRHGGIQADNILWFKDKATSEEVSGVLKIGGFSMAQLHEPGPDEGVDSATVLFTPFHRPPKHELKLPIFRSSDIWSLACLYLEFITWLLKGDKGIKEFSLFRRHISYYTGVKRDSFFTLAGKDDDSTITASVSGKVIAWIDRLHEYERCSALIHDFLDLIMEKLLVIDSKDRCTANWLHERLLGFLARASEDDDYLLEPIPRIPEGSRDFPDIVTSDSMDNLRKVVQ